MSCEKLSAGMLADYWAGAPVEDDVEEHLFACEECSARLGEVAAMARGIRELARQGSLLMVVSEIFLRRIAEEGLRLREYAPPPGGAVACTVAAEDDFLIGRLTADLSEAARVDLAICDERGNEQMRLTDIPFHPAAGGVAFEQPITYAKAAPTSTMIARLVGFDPAGGERVLGEYTFNHTRTLPGPGAW